MEVDATTSTNKHSKQSKRQSERSTQHCDFATAEISSLTDSHVNNDHNYTPGSNTDPTMSLAPRWTLNLPPKYEEESRDSVLTNTSETSSKKTKTNDENPTIYPLIDELPLQIKKLSPPKNIDM